MTANCMKTKFMVFTPRGKKVPEIEIRLNDQQILQTHTHRHLGFILNDRLNWNNHIQHICTKVNKQIGLLRTLRHFLSPRLLDNVYKTYILPIFDYGDIVYDPRSTTNVKKLDKLQQHCLELTSTNITATPLEKRRLLHQLVFMFKLTNKLTPQHLQNTRLPTYNELDKRTTRHKHFLEFPRPRTEAMRCSPVYRAAQAWNSAITEQTRELKQLKRFRSSAMLDIGL